MDKSKLLDIGEYAIPSIWRHQMIVQNFNPMQGTPQDLVNFCKLMECTELLDDPTPNKAKPTKHEEPSCERSSTKGCKYCEYISHNKDECFKLKVLKRKMVTTPQHSEGDFNKHPCGYLWKKPLAKLQDEAYLNKEQAMAFIN